MTATETTQQIVPAYRVTITEGYYMGDQGVSLSLDPWGGDTHYIKGYDEPIRVLIPADAEVLESEEMGKLLYRNGDYKRGYDIPEAISLGWASVIKDGE